MDEEALSYGIREGERLCVRCGHWLRTSEFHVGTSIKKGKSYTYHSKICDLCLGLSRYQMDRNSYFVQLARQGGVCAICQWNEPGGTGRWHVDHNHACCESLPTCGECNRGLLCSTCNTGLGLFRDDPEYLRRAADYLDFEYA